MEQTRGTFFHTARLKVGRIPRGYVEANQGYFEAFYRTDGLHRLLCRFRLSADGDAEITELHCVRREDVTFWRNLLWEAPQVSAPLPKPKGRRIDFTTVKRLVRVGQFRQMATQAIREPARHVLERARAERRKRGEIRGGRPSRGPLFYACFAEAYVNHAHEGNVWAILAKQFNLPEATVRDCIHATRKYGFLSDTVRGQRGGTLTEEAKKVLSVANGRGSDTSDPGQLRRRNSEPKPRRATSVLARVSPNFAKERRLQ
jgi:hypothetical protein